ncbi:MAG: anti-sigma factor family protein [Pyrinomonadaceae bacterium]
MKCQEVAAVLADYFDGELDERHSRTVAAHLSACAECAEMYGALQREQDLFMRYERDVEVTPQLWQGVAARIAADKIELQQVAAAPRGTRLRDWLANTFTVPRFSPALTAALVLVAVALTVGAMTLMNKRASTTGIATQTPTPAPTTNKNANESPTQNNTANEHEQREPQLTADNVGPRPQPSVAPTKHEEKREKTLPTNEGLRIQQVGLKQPLTPREPTAEDLVRDAEAKYQKAIQILSRDVNKRRPALDAETLARFDDTLKVLDRTIAETRRAALGPGNSDPVAVQYMLTAYEKKVEVMREMARN